MARKIKFIPVPGTLIRAFRTPEDNCVYFVASDVARHMGYTPHTSRKVVSTWRHTQVIYPSHNSLLGGAPWRMVTAGQAEASTVNSIKSQRDAVLRALVDFENAEYAAVPLKRIAQTPTITELPAYSPTPVYDRVFDRMPKVKIHFAQVRDAGVNFLFFLFRDVAHEAGYSERSKAYEALEDAALEVFSDATGPGRSFLMLTAFQIEGVFEQFPKQIKYATDRAPLSERKSTNDTLLDILEFVQATPRKARTEWTIVRPPNPLHAR